MKSLSTCASITTFNYNHYASPAEHKIIVPVHSHVSECISCLNREAIKVPIWTGPASYLNTAHYNITFQTAGGQVIKIYVPIINRQSHAEIYVRIRNANIKRVLTATVHTGGIIYMCPRVPLNVKVGMYERCIFFIR